MQVVHLEAAGIDIGNESHYVAVPPSRDNQPVRCFGCTTAELKVMADWLKQCSKIDRIPPWDHRFHLLSVKKWAVPSTTIFCCSSVICGNTGNARICRLASSDSGKAPGR